MIPEAFQTNVLHVAVYQYVRNLILYYLLKNDCKGLAIQDEKAWESFQYLLNHLEYHRDEIDKEFLNHAMILSLLTYDNIKSSMSVQMLNGLLFQFEKGSVSF